MSFGDLTLATENSDDDEPPHFKPEAVARIVQTAREPFKTMFSLAWATGLRAGELLGLCVSEVDLERGIITPRKQADHRTRELRALKIKRSRSPIPITAEVSAMLSEYLRVHWKGNVLGLLFPNRTGRPRKRANVVKFGLKPVLQKLGLPFEGYGLHAFRHGLGTARSNSKVSPKTVQQILRHTDIKTTFRYYVHSDVETQRSALAAVAIGTTVPIGTAVGA